MKILVGIKHVPDTETKVRVASDGVSLDESGVKMVISPFDEFALEEALRIRERGGGGEVVVACCGPDAAQATLRTCLAIGADRAVLVKDDRFDRADALARASALAGVARAEGPDLVLLGKVGVGMDEGQTGPMLAELLDLPHAGSVTALAIEGGSLTARREVEGGVEILEGSLPAVVTCDKGLNEPRLPGLKGIMAAKKKEIAVRTAAEAGVDEALLASPRVSRAALELPPPRQAGKILEGEPSDTARELVRLLRDEAKVL